MTKHNKFSPNKSVRDSSPEVGDSSAKKAYDIFSSENKIRSNKEDNILVPIFSNLNLNSKAQNGENLFNKKHHPSLTLELTKAFSPSSTPWNKRYFLKICRLEFINIILMNLLINGRPFELRMFENI
jgi:hypothetical protein